MTTTITSHLMTSTVTEHYAHRVLDPLPTEAPWRASWLPGRRLDYCQATTAMVVAETVALHQLEPGGRWWPHLQGWARELDLDVEDAVELAGRELSGASR